MKTPKKQNSHPWQGVRGVHKKPPLIIPEKTARNQGLARLQRAIDDKRLTDCLRILEGQGYAGETATFILGVSQQIMGGLNHG